MSTASPTTPLLGDQVGARLSVGKQGEQTSLLELIDEEREEWALKLWWNQDALIENTATMRLVVEMFKAFQSSIEQSPQDTLYFLSSLEQRFSEAGDFGKMFMYLFAEKADEMFGPAPSADTMRDFSTDLKHLAHCTFEGHEFETIGRAKRQHGRSEYQTIQNEIINDETKNKEFTHLLQETIVNTLHSKYKDHIVLRWFINGLLRAADEGLYAFLGVLELQNLDKLCMEKELLCWSAVGQLCHVLLIYESMERRHFVYGRTTNLFQEFMTRTTPGFVFQLTKYQGVLESQVKKVTEYQAKILAFLVTLALSLVQFFLKSHESKS